MNWRVRGLKGQFVRKHDVWSLENFNDGYVDTDGRFRVYYPSHPRASKQGYVLREIVAYESYHGELVPLGFEIHHKNENRTDDSKENLQKLTNGEHQHIHKEHKVAFVCLHCGVGFFLDQYKVNKRTLEGRIPKYCGQACYHESRVGGAA